MSKPKAEPGELKYCKEHRTIHCSCQQREIERLEAELAGSKTLTEIACSLLEDADTEKKQLREALEKAGEIICDTCEDACPFDGPCDETKFIERALKGE